MDGRDAQVTLGGQWPWKARRVRVIYYWWDAGLQFWLFTLYGKDEMNDLTPQQCKALKTMIKTELETRRKP